MKTLYLLACLLPAYLQAAAQTQTTSEVTYWTPKNFFSHRLQQSGTTLTIQQDGRPLQTREYNGTQLSQLTLYNTDGLPVEMQQYSTVTGSKLSNCIEYTYNDKRQKKTETEYNVQGSLTQTKYYTYNAGGLLLEVRYSPFFDKMDKRVEIHENYTYDDQGRLLTKTRSSNRSRYPSRWLYEYSTDENNHKKVKELYTATKRKPKLSKASVYDNRGNLVREYENRSGNSEDVVRTFGYTFNEQGDWTTKKVYEQRYIYETRFTGEYRRTLSQ
ncbi:hypothetical protein [Taibaiella chishuiensis]|uniref:YD repeat-containing protein n=1 Tax=Taibaiella chishuiensis TaxID=1434707 RepID=A0A2P8DBC1_9BACT|nr:hypothetical protein [Taibaiella chishuiensis]PSK94521.1 YD repeat-containing protein [Taibaiella chishuiensis]